MMHASFSSELSSHDGPGHREKEPVRTDFHVLGKTGERVDIEADISLIEDASRQPAAFLIVARDVTERKRMEQRLDSNTR